MEFKFDKNKVFVAMLAIIIVAVVFKNNSQGNMHIVSPSEMTARDETQNEASEGERSDALEVYEEEEPYIKVYVSGEVVNCGVIEISRDARLVDAVEKLGGLTQNADVNGVNLAQRLEDGGHYIVPKIGDDIEQSQSGQAGSQNIANDKDSKIDINSADEEKLKELPGIGDVIAQRIVQYRDQNGKFKSIDQLKNVSGIGDKKFEGIKDMIMAQ